MSNEIFNHSKKLNDALQVLNDAAKEKKDEIQKLLSDRYADIQDALHDVAVQGRRNFKKAQRAATHAIEEGEERIKEVAGDVDRNVRKNPWAYIGGAAVGALLLGYILGASKSRD